MSQGPVTGGDPELLEELLLEELLAALLEPELLEPELPELPPEPAPLLTPDAPADPALPIDPELLAADPPTPGEEPELSPRDPQA
jgi:hypothetical protein